MKCVLVGSRFFGAAVLEALHELNLRGLTHHLSEPAANWLVALPLDVPAEDLRPYRLFPSSRINSSDAPRNNGPLPDDRSGRLNTCAGIGRPGS